MILSKQAKQAVFSAMTKCRVFFDKLTGAEAARQITAFHDDVEAVSSALVVRVQALELRSEQSNANHDTRIRGLERRMRMQATLSVVALAISVVCLLLRLWEAS